MTYTIGEIARRAEINISTLRFYERRGLVPEPARNAYGHRLYGAGEVNRLRFIKRAQRLGFTLAEIKELLALREQPAANCGRVREHAARRLHATDQKIDELVGVRRTLTQLVEACDESDPDSCPAIAELERTDAPA
ncbi:MAG: heavy metal-responsive transcriptional regulator [Gemmatimonadota bacterium]|nr:heavy metal-responsive transcriptional regulator [Gemmatimonadota bacterium]